MRKKIFISYRRTDTSSASGRIYDRLATRYDKDNVFKDIDSIPAGVDFRTYINDIIPQCAVMLVVIGQTWLAPDVATGRPRIHAPDDLVRQEIEVALAHQVTLIPVLVEGAGMPSAQDLVFAALCPPAGPIRAWSHGASRPPSSPPRLALTLPHGGCPSRSVAALPLVRRSLPMTGPLRLCGGRVTSLVELAAPARRPTLPTYAPRAFRLTVEI